jgi:hypothetical protein
MAGREADAVSLPDDWSEPDPELLDRLTRIGTLAADSAVMALRGETEAARTAAAVRASLRVLLANNVISPVEATSPWVWLDPPHGAMVPMGRAVVDWSDP